MAGDRLIGQRGRALRLWDEEGRPVTDYDGRPLKILGGRLLVVWEPLRGELRDPLGRALRDAHNRSPADQGFDPEAQTVLPPALPLSFRYIAIDARPLTDCENRPLADPRGRYLLQSGFRPQTDTLGRQVFEAGTGEEEVGDFTGKVWLWDEDDRPLTDPDGCPLRDLFGRTLLMPDSGTVGVARRTRYGAAVFDARHHNPTHRSFDPNTPSQLVYKNTVAAAFKGLVSEKRVVFDERGLPLTSTSGEPLTGPDGTPLLIGIKGDLIEISLSHYDSCRLKVLLSSRLLPLRLFDPQGRPVTSHLGEPLNHADGRLLVIFDKQGHPAHGPGGAMIYDEFGVPVSNPDCRPDEPLEGAPTLIKAGPGLFDSDGLPLTDCRGYSLLSATRELLIQQATPEHHALFLDRRGTQVYCESGLPLTKTLDKPLLGARGRPCRLFDDKGLPLTDMNGLPLKYLNGGYSLTRDNTGRIKADGKGGSVFDSAGVSISWPTRFNPCRPVPVNNDNPRAYRGNHEGIQLFDGRGLPVTGPRGDPLTTATGESLVLVDPEDGVLRLRDGRPVFDLAGRPQRGSTYIPGAAGDAATAKTKMEIYQLFDCDQSPIFDNAKGVRELKGCPLVVFDAEGRVASDSRGRDVFDSRGLPLTRVSGTWKGPKGQPIRLFDDVGRPLTDHQGRPLVDVAGRSLVREDQIGRPLFNVDGTAARDVCGRTYADPGFCPMEGPPAGSVLRDTDDGPMRAFDVKGRPLTDQSGTVLVAFDGTPLLEGPLRRLRTKGGGRAFDCNGVPLGCAPGEVLASPTGDPLRLFSRSGAPLTCPRGRPLRFANDLPVLVFDMLGRPLQDAEGGPVCDARGVALGLPNCRPHVGPPVVNPQSIALRLPNGRSLRLFDSDGRPLTATDGRPLPRADGTLLRLCPKGNPLAAPDGGPLFDQYGSRVQTSSKE